MVSVVVAMVAAMWTKAVNITKAVMVVVVVVMAMAIVTMRLMVWVSMVLRMMEKIMAVGLAMTKLKKTI